jgi:hypothetical protein
MKVGWKSPWAREEVRFARSFSQPTENRDLHIRHAASPAAAGELVRHQAAPRWLWFLYFLHSSQSLSATPS